MIPHDLIPDYDLARDMWQERLLVAAEERAERLAYEDEIADGLISDPDFDLYPEWEDD